MNFAPNEFEILFVDDHSSDGTVDTINTNVNASLNYKVIRRSSNSGGASIPRNEGIALSRGEYIFFLDSDDTVDRDLLSHGYEFAKKCNSDIVFFKYGSISGRSVAKRPFKTKFVEQASLSKNHLFRSVNPSKFFLRTFLLENKILFPADIKVGEDKLFMLKALTKAKKISILADKKYVFMSKHDEGHLSRAKTPFEDFMVWQQAIHYILVSNMPEDVRKASYNAWLNFTVEKLTKWLSSDLELNTKLYFLKSLSLSYKYGEHLLNYEEIYPENKILVKPFFNANLKQFLSAQSNSACAQLRYSVHSFYAKHMLG